VEESGEAGMLDDLPAPPTWRWWSIASSSREFQPAHTRRPPLTATNFATPAGFATGGG